MAGERLWSFIMRKMSLHAGKRTPDTVDMSQLGQGRRQLGPWLVPATTQSRKAQLFRAMSPTLFCGLSRLRAQVPEALLMTPSLIYCKNCSPPQWSLGDGVCSLKESCFPFVKGIVKLQMPRRNNCSAGTLSFFVDLTGRACQTCPTMSLPPPLSVQTRSRPSPHLRRS